MSHVPTSLYIDMEAVKRQGLRFDTKVFTTLTGTFAKGGLRLLVPTIMERELLRHFSREAEMAADAITNAHNAYPVNNLALVELPSQEELKTKCGEVVNHQWSFFKEHFVVETLRSEKTLNTPGRICCDSAALIRFDLKMIRKRRGPRLDNIRSILC
jgi:hypothetical protein